MLLFGDNNMDVIINTGSRASPKGQAELYNLGNDAPSTARLSAKLAELAQRHEVSHTSLWLPHGPLLEELDLRPLEALGTRKTSLKEGMIGAGDAAFLGALSDEGLFRQKHVHFMDTSAMMHGAIRMERLFYATKRPSGQWYEDFVHPSPWVLRTPLDGLLSTICPLGEFVTYS
jgi:hypothetical protein